MRSIKYYACIIILLLSSCAWRDSNRYETEHLTSHRNGLLIQSTKIRNPHSNLYVEHAGKIRFSKDQASILSLDPGGYLIYKKDDRSLFAERVHEVIEVAVVINGTTERSAQLRDQMIREAHAALVYTDSLRFSEVKRLN